MVSRWWDTVRCGKPLQTPWTCRGDGRGGLAGDRMAEGYDYLWWEEYRDDSQGLEKTFTPAIIGKGAILNNLEGLIQMRVFDLPPVILIFGLFYIILHTFLAGGILSCFRKGGLTFTLKDFFQGAGLFFFRFALLIILSWIFFLIIGLGVKGGFDSILDGGLVQSW